ncbi:helix-turn-helix domain-containing protein [Cesiribacter sp. SM1]|uniref:helix-turn-helix domain-containing protein n=1 Tax=Cesiribacter sp. SM1 TaxID=2861196 RepID=UPI001CD4C028|nr:helix-turn-helix domain-containing protein [Cesiribacter sp. SM1]
MNEEIVYINNMSSPRDILLVSQALEHLGLRVKEIEIGAAAYMNPEEVERGTISRALENIGYALIDPEAKLFAERIRSLISSFIDEMLRRPQHMSLEEFLEQECKESFGFICQRFQTISGQRLRIYYKRMRIERVKILLNHSTLTLQEIARKLDFKSGKNLSRTFKEVTGQPISAYTKRQLVTSMQKIV